MKLASAAVAASFLTNPCALFLSESFVLENATVAGTVPTELSLLTNLGEIVLLTSQSCYGCLYLTSYPLFLIIFTVQFSIYQTNITGPIPLWLTDLTRLRKFVCVTVQVNVGQC